MGMLPEEVLSEYIQIDTSSNSGNEMNGLMFMKTIAEELGLFTYIQKTALTKGNLIITSRIEDLKPFEDKTNMNPNKIQPIILLSHVDVVPAIQSDWKYPPFSGEIVDGEVWGRGAIDAKQIGISHLFTLCKLKNLAHQKPLIQLITSEEETGSKNGLLSFLEVHGDYFENALVFNEGGGFPIILGSTQFYLVETGQKGNASFTVKIPATRNSNPYLPSIQSELELLDVINVIQNIRIPNERLPHSVKEMFDTIALELNTDFREDDQESFFLKLPDHLIRMFSAMSKSTLTATVLNGGRKNKLWNGSYEVKVDARPLPNTDEVEFKSFVEKEIHSVCPKAIISWGEYSTGYDQIVNQSLMRILDEELVEEIPSAVIVPFMTIGSNDGRHVIPYNANVVGYCPMTPEMSFDKVLSLVHGVDERISIKDLHFGIEQLTTILKTYICEYLKEDEYLEGK